MWPEIDGFFFWNPSQETELDHKWRGLLVKEFKGGIRNVRSKYNFRKPPYWIPVFVCRIPVKRLKLSRKCHWTVLQLTSRMWLPKRKSSHSEDSWEVLDVMHRWENYNILKMNYIGVNVEIRIDRNWGTEYEINLLLWWKSRKPVILKSTGEIHLLLPSFWF